MCRAGKSCARSWRRGASRDESSAASARTRPAISACWSNGASSYFCQPSFFQPFDLHVEPADLLVEFGLARLSLLTLASPSVAEEVLDAVEELFLPLADLDGVDLVRLRQFGDGLGL